MRAVYFNTSSFSDAVDRVRNTPDLWPFGNARQAANQAEASRKWAEMMIDAGLKEKWMRNRRAPLVTHGDSASSTSRASTSQASATPSTSQASASHSTSHALTYMPQHHKPQPSLPRGPQTHGLPPQWTPSTSPANHTQTTQRSTCLGHNRDDTLRAGGGRRAASNSMVAMTPAIVCRGRGCRRP